METVSKKQKKGGRPTKPVKKDVKISVRYSYTEHFVVKEKAATAGLNISRYIRDISIKGEVKARWTDEERKWLKDLIGMSNNVNQTAKAANKEGVLTAMLHFESYRNLFDEILKKFKQ